MRADRVTWDKLQDDSERRFGSRAARLYPFLRLEPLKGYDVPLVRTHLGTARLLSVISLPGEPEQAEIVLEQDLERTRNWVGEGKPPVVRAKRLPVHMVHPPLLNPPKWQCSVFASMLTRLAEVQAC